MPERTPLIISARHEHIGNAPTISTNDHVSMNSAIVIESQHIGNQINSYQTLAKVNFYAVLYSLVV